METATSPAFAALWASQSGGERRTAQACLIEPQDAPRVRVCGKYYSDQTQIKSATRHFTVIWRVVFIEVPVLKKASNWAWSRPRAVSCLLPPFILLLRAMSQGHRPAILRSNVSCGDDDASAAVTW